MPIFHSLSYLACLPRFCKLLWVPLGGVWESRYSCQKSLLLIRFVVPVL